MTSLGPIGPYVSILIQGVGLALGLLCNMLLARFLGANGYGEYSVVYSLITIVGVPLEVGLAMVMVREISANLATRDWGRVRGAVRASFFVTMTFTVPCAAFVLLATFFQAAWFGPYLATAAWATLLLPAASLVAVRSSVLRGLGNPLIGQILGSIIRPSVFSLLLVAWYFFWVRSSSSMAAANIAMALHACAVVSALIVGLVATQKVWPEEIRQSHPIYNWRQWAKDIPGFSLMAAGFATNQIIGSLLLAYYQTPAEVGVYRVAELGASLVSLPLSTLAIYFSADLSRLLISQDYDELRKTLRHAARISFLGALPISIVFLLFGRELVSFVFGQQFSGAKVPLAILTVAQLANAFTGLVGIFVNMAGHHREALVAVAAAIGVQITVALVLVPDLAATGAAIASALATLVWSQWLRLKIRRRYGISSLPV